jgi:hypothetical protein
MVVGADVGVDVTENFGGLMITSVTMNINMAPATTHKVVEISFSLGERAGIGAFSMLPL